MAKSSVADLESFQNVRLKFSYNLLTAYLNINSLRNQVIDLGEILKDLLLDYLVIVKPNWMNVFQMTNLSLMDI